MFRALDELNEQLPADRRLRKRLDAPLAEPEGPLDSLGLMNLVVAAEEALEAETGRVLSLADAAESDERPFSTVGSLVAYIERLLAAGE